MPDTEKTAEEVAQAQSGMEPAEEESETEVKRVRVDNLLPGMVVPEPLTDGDGNTLLGADSELTEVVIKALFEKEIMKVPVKAASYKQVRESSDQDGVEGVEFTDEDLVEMGEEAAREFLLDEKQRQEELTEELRQFYKQLLGVVEDNFEAIESGSRVNVDKNRLRLVMILGYLNDAPTKTLNLLRFRSRENYLYSQSANAAILGMHLGEKMGFERQKKLDVGLGTILHNVGMLEFADVLEKDEGLTDAEKTMLKSHPRIYEEKIRSIDGLDDQAASIVFEHHERLDGSGFPKGLQFGEVSELSAVAMVAIEFVELIQPRILENRVSGRLALEKIRPKSGDAFWEEPVEQLEEIVKQDFRLHSPGTVVELGGGELAVVLEMTKHDSQPVINIVVDRDGRPLEEPERVELAESDQKYIDSVAHENLIEV